MTNILWLTNQVWLITTNPVPVVITDDPHSWDTMYNGFTYGLPFALVLAIVWAVGRAVKPPGFPND